MIDHLIDKTALVTGASRGIGRAIAIALAGAEADVIVNYVTTGEVAKKYAGKRREDSYGQTIKCIPGKQKN